MTYDADKAGKWLETMKDCDEPVMHAITTHLYTEYAIDYLLSKLANGSKIQKYNFSTKLNVAYGCGLIEQGLYDNINKLNKIRNDYAHKLDANFLQLDLEFVDPEGRVKIAEFKNTMSSIPEKDEIVNCLLWVGIVTFGWIHNQIIKDINS